MTCDSAYHMAKNRPTLETAAAKESYSPCGYKGETAAASELGGKNIFAMWNYYTNNKKIDVFIKQRI